MKEKEMYKKLLGVFIASFFLNLIWENFHSLLYLQYKGGAITEFILLRATLSDAVYITLTALLFFVIKNRRVAIFSVSLILLLISIYIEKWALSASRWEYSELMPIIPIINTGLTPTIQLALLALLSFKINNFPERINKI